MEKLWSFVCTVEVRPVGAQGSYTPVDFPVVMRQRLALPRELFSKWQDMVGDDFESYHMTHVNGCATFGEIDRHFSGEEV